MLVKKLKIVEVRNKLKEILSRDNGEDPRITVQIFEREALYEVFRDVYQRGVAEGRRVEKILLTRKIRKIL